MSRLIDADELIEHVYRERLDSRELVAQMVESAPTIEPERKTGKWTIDNSCPFCGFQPWYERDIHTLSYCPNCGADMREEGEQNAD